MVRTDAVPGHSGQTVEYDVSTIDKIAPPILQENADREAIQEAERALKREHEKILKEKYPCPL